VFPGSTLYTLSVFSTVLGPYRAPRRRLPRALDGTAKSGPHPSWKPQDGGPCKVRQISVGDCGGLPGRGLCINPIDCVSLHPPRADTKIHRIISKEIECYLVEINWLRTFPLIYGKGRTSSRTLDIVYGGIN